MERKNRCCIATCRGERFDLAHKFPRCQEAAEAWLDAIQNPDFKNITLKKLSESYQVCARHFRITDYKHSQSRSLNKLAVPSLNLKDLSQLHLAKDSRPITENPNLRTDNLQSKSQIIELSLKNVEYFEQTGTINLIQNEGSFDADECDSVESIELIEMQPDVLDPVDQEDNDVNQPPASTNDYFDIVHPQSGQKLCLNLFWLRCNCQCSECYDSGTKRKKITPLDIPRHTQPKSIHHVESSNTLIVEWQDGHFSSHDIELLFRNSKNICHGKLAFDSQITGKHAQVQVLKLLSSDDTIRYIFESLMAQGFVSVTNISTQNSTMAKLVIDRLFSDLRSIKFQPFNEIHSEICTNITCANFECGLKCFFATEKTEIILVDGFQVTKTLKEFHLEAYKTLTETMVPLSIQDDHMHHVKSVPIIGIDNKIEGNIKIQLDMHRFGMINLLDEKTKSASFYESLEHLMRLVKSGKNQVSLTLEVGTMIILDNERVLHKLSDGSGVLQFYISRNDFIGRARYFGLL